MLRSAPPPVVLTSLQFHNFRVLENATLPLGAFNLLLGPNGSGKTTAVRALLALGEVARGVRANAPAPVFDDLAGARVAGSFTGVPGDARITLEFDAAGRARIETSSAAVVSWLASVRGYVLDPVALAQNCAPDAPPVLAGNGAGLPAVLAAMRRGDARRWESYLGEVRRLLPEIADIVAGETINGHLAFTVVRHGGLQLRAPHLSQGNLVILALLAIVLSPERPALLCFEELERGIHPRLLRDVRDVLYRLSFPQDWGDDAPAVQVLVTTHSPYVLDLFVDAPEDVVIATREDGAALFRRLVDIPEVQEMLQTGRLGELWYSGILGGVP